MRRLKEILLKILAVILAVLVFYLFLCVTSAWRLERQVEKSLVEMEAKQ